VVVVVLSAAAAAADGAPRPSRRGRLNLPGIFLPRTPFTDSVEYAYVRTANATASELIASACMLLLANVSQARW
jgi:hypothetical protein